MTAASDEAPEILLRHHLKKLKLPTVLREHEKIARPRRPRPPDQTICAPLARGAPPRASITSAISPG